MSDQTSEISNTQGSGAGDPSMEDILASIRRIIADDGAPEAPQIDVSGVETLSAQHTATDALSDQIAGAEQAQAETPLELDQFLTLEDDDFTADDLVIPGEEAFAKANVAIDPADLLGDVDTLEAEISSVLDTGPSDTSFDDTSLVDDLIAGDLSEFDAPLADLSAQEQTAAPEAVMGRNPAAAILAAAIPASLMPEDGKGDDAAGDELLAEFDADTPASDDLETALGLTDEIFAEDDASDEDTSSSLIDTLLSDLGLNDDLDTLDVLEAQDASIEEPAIEEPVIADDDLAALLGGIDDLIESDETESVFALGAEDPVTTDGDVADLLAAELGDTDMDDVSGEESDIDLVKSLMAGLTDTSFEDEDDTSLADPETESSGDDIFDDILELTLEDQEDLQAVAADNTVGNTADGAEGETRPAAADASTSIAPDEDTDVENVDASINALLQIAAAAERDAKTLETDLISHQDEVDSIESLLANDSDEDDSVDMSAVDMSDEEDIAHAGIADALTDAEVDEILTPESASDSLGGEHVDEGVEDETDIDALFAGKLTPPEDDAETEISADVHDETGDKDGFDADSSVEPETDQPEIIPTEIILDEPEAELTAQSDITPDAEAASDDAAVAETKTPETQDPISQETTEMPKLVVADSILDEATEAAASEAFSSLNDIVEEKAVFAESGPRIGDLVQDALKPMLKDWLDANLKSIVERAVAKEVKRISSGK